MFHKAVSYFRHATVGSYFFIEWGGLGLSEFSRISRVKSEGVVKFQTEFSETIDMAAGSRSRV